MYAPRMSYALVPSELGAEAEQATAAVDEVLERAVVLARGRPQARLDVVAQRSCRRDRLRQVGPEALPRGVFADGVIERPHPTSYGSGDFTADASSGVLGDF